MNLAVCIINWNNAKDTLECIRTVSSWQTVNPTIWVIDNNSSDGSPDVIAQEHSPAHLIRSTQNLGFSGANNIAIRAAIDDGHNEILLLNNDAKISEINIILLLEALHKDSTLAIVGPVLRESVGGKIHFSCGGRNIAHYCNTRILSNTAPPISRSPINTDYVPGTVALLRGDVVKSIGLFDERYFFSGEMADLCMRAQYRGYHTAIVTSAFADHDTTRAGGLRNTLYAYYNLRNRFLFASKFASFWWRLFWQVACVVFIASHILFGRFASARAVYLALWDGCRSRFGNQNERILSVKSTK